MEYRRFLLLRLVNPRREIPAPPLVDIYWRLHAADRSAFESDSAALTAGTAMSPRRLVPAPQPAGGPADPEVRALYESTFRYGNADLWGWPLLPSDHRNSAPGVSPVRRRLPFMFTKATHDRLLGEAREHRDTVAEWHSTGYRTGRGTVASPCRTRSANPGRVLHEVHWAGSASRLIAAETSAVVVPTTAAYLYFRSGDFIGIHTHDHGCELTLLTLLTLLSGAVEPLHCHLHQVDVPLDEVRVLAEATGGLPRGGTPFNITAAPLLLSGLRIPHQYRPLDRAGRPSCWCSALRCSPGDWGRQGQAP